jgi:AraC-like DNA-binding protein
MKIGEVEYFTKDLSVEKLVISSVGEQYCKPKHSHGPKIRENYIFHFIVSGKGVFKCHGKTYHLQANQGFLIADNTPIYYEADEKEPWHYCWMIVSGKQAENFFAQLKLSPENPIYKAKSDNEIYTAIKKCMHAFESDEYELIARTFDLFSAYLEYNADNGEESPSNKIFYLKKAEQYILHNFHSPSLRVGKLSAEIGIDRSYLTRLFDVYLGCNPQDYILRLRMEKAMNFLKTTSYSIGTIANSVGYPNIDAFSKMFKRYYKISPTTARKQD